MYRTNNAHHSTNITQNNFIVIIIWRANLCQVQLQTDKGNLENLENARITACAIHL